jgi:hypothetical protein
MLTKKVALILTGRSFPQRAPIGGSTRFQPGHMKIGGRTKGVRNKVSLEYAEQVLAAAARARRGWKGSWRRRGLLSHVSATRAQNLPHAAARRAPR